MNSLSLSQVLHYHKSLPIGRSHIFNYEFSVEEIYFCMTAWHMLIFTRKVVVRSAAQRVCWFDGQINEDLLGLVGDCVETRECNGFWENVKWSDFEQVWTDLDQHVLSQFNLVMNLDEWPSFRTQIHQLELLALLDDLCVLVLNRYFKTLNLIGQSSANFQSFFLGNVVRILRAIEMFYYQADGCWLLCDHLLCVIRVFFDGFGRLGFS